MGSLSKYIRTRIEWLREHRAFLFDFLRRFAVYSLGVAVPGILGLLAVPYLARQVSPLELGVLSLMWTFLGFLGNFDLGLGRAIGRFVATGASSRGSYIAAGFVGQFSIGTALGILVVSGLLLSRDKVAPFCPPYVLVAIFLSVPFATILSGMRFALESGKRQGHSALIGMLSNALIFAIPVLIQRLGGGVIESLFYVFSSRVIVALVPIFLYWKFFELRTAQWGRLGHFLLELVRFGGWVSVSNLTSMINVYGDKLVSGRFFALDRLSAYTIPADFIGRLSIIPAVMVRLATPSLDGRSISPGDASRSILISWALALAFGAACVFSIPILPSVMHGWIGGRVGLGAGGISQIVLLGVSVSGFTYLAATLHVSYGNARMPALITIGLLPIVAAGVWVAVIRNNIEYLALSSALRTLLEGVMLIISLPRSVGELYQNAILSGFVALMVTGVALAIFS